MKRCATGRRPRLGSRIKKYFDGGFSGHVTVEREGTGFRTDCTLHLASGVTLQAEGDAHDAYQSSDQAAERIESGCDATSGD